MHTHFKRCYLCKMCIHFFGTLCIYLVEQDIQYTYNVTLRRVRVTIVVESSITARFALVWDFLQRRMVVSFRRFGTTFEPHLQMSGRFSTEP